VGGGAARLYEPVLGRLLGGVRRSVLALAPPRAGLVVVDVGCGTGALLARYAAAGCRVAGADASAVMLAQARRSLGQGALLVEADGARLPFAAGSADLVVATMLLHSLPAQARLPVLAEMGRVAGERGRVVVADHRPGPSQAASEWWARLGARGIEAVAGHLGGVRALDAAGGVSGLAPAAGLEVEAESLVAAGALAVTRLHCRGAGA
jgi:ubiquinone/menaquinone biosynthesis C-methylase UbiE